MADGSQAKPEELEPQVEEEPAASSAVVAAEPPAPLAPIIVKKIMDDGHGGAHGGAWKIALADMMTAMMAFFLLMWLLGASNADQRKSIADYFRPTSHSNVTMGKLAGSDGMLGGRSVIDPDGFPFASKQTAAMERVTPRSQGGPTENDPSPNSEERNNPESLTEAEKKQIAEQKDKADFDKLEKEVKESLAKNPRLENLTDQVKFVREKEGLRIEIIDKADFAMFGLGTTQLTPKAQVLLNEVAKSMTKMDNKLAIRGHTDSVAFANTDGRNNWSLSAERAEETRKIIGKKGVPENRFAKIEGVADSAPYNPNDPKDPRNRRISITVMYKD
ncbi:flagellar motor protein MotB [Limnohabitans sp. Rim8]|uniref:flagellar motor protein MotB n=1 Tax=Limnohabitans sp. Rim8 TaxID=1100718 RepID=UPI00261EB28E|nr:flagellar motor protein MotB [Limnohabitans sp. Rim8]